MLKSSGTAPSAGFGSGTRSESYRSIQRCFYEDAEVVPPDPETIKKAKSIAISPGGNGPIELEADDWPEDDGTTLVVDFTIGHPEIPKIEARGYRVLTTEDCRIGTLQRCLQQWTGQPASREIIHDAVEEYLGV